MKKITTEEFIEKAKKKHGDKYDYSKVEYIDCFTKVCIICPEHGEFFITPANFLYGQGCRLCGIKDFANKRRDTVENFVKKAREIHGDKFDYSKVEYVNCDTNVCIICPEHGEFWQTPYTHIHSKKACPKCSGNVKYSTEEFIKKAKEIHGDKYDYSKVEYVNAYTKICIICQTHGEFWQTPSGHLNGNGCPKCKGKNKTTESFIEEIKAIHGDKYDLSKVVYNGAFNPVRVVCKKHGEFITTPHMLLSGSGCPKCGIESCHEKQRLTTEEFVKRSKKIHGDKYDYSKVNYVNAKTPVCLVCPKHGNFYVIPNKNTSSHRQGCPKCAESILETDVRVLCEENNIEFKQQKTFPWLGLQRFDFYLPKFNIAIECQGTYHFEPHYTETGETSYDLLLSQIKRDELKNELSKENNVNLLYYVPTNLMEKSKISKIYNNENTISSMGELLEKLKQENM